MNQFKSIFFSLWFTELEKLEVTKHDSQCHPHVKEKRMLNLSWDLIRSASLSAENKAQESELDLKSWIDTYLVPTFCPSVLHITNTHQVTFNGS